MISISLIFRILLANIFISTSFSKIKKFTDFKKTVFSFTKVNNPRVILILSIFVITAELILTLLLFFQSTRWIGALGISILLLVFTILISFNLKKKNIIKCSCGGVLGSSFIGKKTILRNLSLMLLSFAILIIPTGTNTVNVYNFILLELGIIFLFTGLIIARNIHNLLNEKWDLNAD
ncbi:DoxX family membrane protein [Bacillus subtilis]|uniref:MauE/DoxX family redox-associated membrane protein n=1 Tax=Bacillus subtilis TaxID=1423 RepID=UPI001D06067A|nr:MauE/DoxX family redox-associated membrane protein [Bacillus subtilis]MCB7162579.1 DoxX family membrane protein [Bacillus subtilis]MCB7461205.1 DoxX family membrane protein [Bacillus subtilis]